MNNPSSGVSETSASRDSSSTIQKSFPEGINILRFLRRSLYLHLRVGVVVGSIWESALRSGNRTTWDCWKYRCSKQQTREDLFLLDLSSYISFQKSKEIHPKIYTMCNKLFHISFSYITHLTNSYFETKILLKLIMYKCIQLSSWTCWRFEKKTVQQQSMRSQTSPKTTLSLEEPHLGYVYCIYLEIFLHI